MGTVVYMALAWWLARAATPEELVSDYTIMIDRAAWAPRILQALADSGVLPGGTKLAERTPKGEPRNAVRPGR